MLPRRTFLTAPLLTPALTDRALREDALQLPDGSVFSCPRRRARVLAVLRLRLIDVTCLGFAHDTGDAVQDVLALVGPGARLLAVERLSWRGDRAELSTRVTLMPDRVHIALQRAAGRYQGAWRRQAWTDYLVATDGRLVDAPPRPVLAGTWQDTLALERRATAAIVQGRHRAEPAALTLFDRSPFDADPLILTPRATPASPRLPDNPPPPAESRR